jgi:hypothetical protein
MGERRVSVWVQRVLSWLSEGLRLIAGVVVVVVLLAIALQLATERTERFVGLLFQLLGLGAIVLDVVQTKRLFGLPGFAAGTLDWLRRFPKRGHHIAPGAGRVSATSSVGAFAQVRKDPKDQSVEERLAALEANVSTVYDDISGIHHSLGMEVDQREAAVRKEQHEREQSVREVRELLERSRTGGLELSFWGAVWIAIGIILTTFPVEIANYLTASHH